MGMKRWWTVVKLVDAERPEAITIVRKGKMTKKGLNKLAKKYNNKLNVIKKFKTAAFRHVLSAKKPRY